MSPLQKDADHAVVVAITSSAAFGADNSDDLYSEGVAFPLLQVKVQHLWRELSPSF